MGGEKELIEKLGGKDPCPCGSGRRFPALLSAHRTLRRRTRRLLRAAT
ncbi:SEC-C metal-binding domain-containing protein [Actinoallomurus sp. CA-142502]